MAEVLATQSHLGMDTTRNHSSTGPLPNPPFVFPVPSDVTSEAHAHGRSTSNLVITGSRRPASRSRPQQLSLNALPAFEFSPSSPSPIDRPHSPPRSPTRKTPPPYHMGGHRRNGSEFVGGDISNGGPVLVSSSPTRNEHSKSHQSDATGHEGGDLASDGQGHRATSFLQYEDPPRSQLDARTTPGRRGHAHRRSGAISSHDLSTILRPSTDGKSGSAPTTPLDTSFQHTHPLDQSISQPTTTCTTPSMPMTEVKSSNTSEQSRARAVEFSDVLEYIPRPLSTISSETSSSMSTIRASHSVTNSITSLVSGGTSSSPSAASPRSRPEPALEQDQIRARPSTAGPPTSFPSGITRWDSADGKTLMHRPSTAPTENPPTLSDDITRVEPSQRVSPTTEQPHISLFSGSSMLDSEQNAATTVSVVSNLQQLRRRPSPSVNPATIRPRTSPEPKITKRQRKRKSLADLLSRKAKQEKQRDDSVSRRSPTPPLRKSPLEAELSLDDFDFDNDTTFVTETASPNASGLASLQTDSSASRSEVFVPLADCHSVSMLDLDAALGSLETPSSGPAFDDVVGAGTSTKRRMHSSGVTGGFAGPGMHYHRRAESAPELDAIDRSRFGFPRLGSDPSMAIEEEEEEEDDDEAVANAATTQIGLGVNIVEAASMHDEPIQRRRRRTKPGNPLKTESPQQHYEEGFGSIEIVGADEEPRFSVVTKSSDESTITPTLSHDPLETRPASAPFELIMPTPALTFGTSETPSVVSSPDFNQTSFDVPRIHTATSSITDRATLSSNRTGENSMGVHSSVDDVPSLTSSASTMSARQPRVSSSTNTFSSAERSSSLSAAIPARTRPVSAGKRASLASLSRLVGSSYNRSKLNIEMSAPPDSDEPVEKKKGHRISRLMKFWKSKEKRSAS